MLLTTTTTNSHTHDVDVPTAPVPDTAAGTAGNLLVTPVGLAGAFTSLTASRAGYAPSRTIAGATAFASEVDEVETLGYATMGDGGRARYRRVCPNAEPSHHGKFKDANNAWFEIASSPLKLEMFGAQTDGATFCKAVNAARVLRRKLLLPTGDIAVSGRYAHLAIDGDYIDIEGPGADLCRLVASTPFPHSSVIIIGCPQRAGSVDVEFPEYGDQTTTMTENFDCLIANAVDIGAYRFTATEGHGIQVGDILRLKSTRMDVQRCESRGAIFQGELNRVTDVVGDVITVEYPLAHRYYNSLGSGIVAETATPATKIKLTGLTPPVAKNQMIGARLEVLSGPGAGQTRYVEEFVSDIADIQSRWNRGYGQAIWSPLLEDTSVVQYRFQTYIAIYRPNGAAVRLKGFSIVGTGGIDQEDKPVNPVNSISIRGIVDPYIEDVKCIKTTTSGIEFRNCVRPRVVGGGAADCNDTALGYGLLFTECRDSISSNFVTRNCRASVDCSGTIKSVGARIEGGSMIGGYADARGDAWSESNPNRGPGDHGQSLDWTWDGITVEGTIFHCIQRGTNVAFKNIRHLGRPRIAYYSLLAGYGTTIEGHDVNARLDFTLDSFPNDDGETSGNFIQWTGAKYRGGLYVGQGRVNGLTNAFLKLSTINNVANLADDERFLGPCRIERQTLICRRNDAGVTKFIEMQDATTFVPVDWSIERPDVTLAQEGNGSFQLMDSGMLLAGATATPTPTLIRIGDTWVVVVADDKFVAIPVYGDVQSSQILVLLFERAADSTYKCEALVRRESTIFSGTHIGGATANIAALATEPDPLLGGSGADGDISFYYDGNFLYVENRSGKARSFTVKVTGY